MSAEPRRAAGPPAVWLRPWRLSDLRDITAIAEDEHLRHWSSMSDDPDGWIRREVAQQRGPSRAVCLAGADRAVGRVALRLPRVASDAVRCEAVTDADRPAGELSYWLMPAVRGRGLALAAVRLMIDTVVASTGLRSVVLDIEADNGASLRLAQRLGAERRRPSRVEVDRGGTPRTLVVHVLRVRPGPAGLSRL